jgi:hypothetical protein
MPRLMPIFSIGFNLIPISIYGKLTDELEMVLQ